MQMSGPRLVLVVAADENGVIGSEGGLPWRLSSDLKHFRKLTLGHPVIMGRKTYDSIGKPLVGRDNIVVSRDPGFRAAGIDIARSFDEALDVGRKYAHIRQADEVAVIGGAQIYSAALPHADRIYLTRVHGTFDGDVVLPALDPEDWVEIRRERHEAGPKDDADFSFIVLDRSLR